MKVQKFFEYLILEGATPENYMEEVITNIKNNLDPVFDEEKVKKLKEFKNANLRLLNDPQIDLWSPTKRTIKYKFTDDDIHVYELLITINLKDAINETPDKDYNPSDIKKAVVSFTKYTSEDGGLNKVAQLMDRTVSPEDIKPDFLIKLKVDLDEGKLEPEKEEEFKIETETPEQGQEAPAQGEMPAEESEEQTTPPAQGA